MKNNEWKKSTKTEKHMGKSHLTAAQAAAQKNKKR